MRPACATRSTSRARDTATVGGIGGHQRRRGQPAALRRHPRAGRRRRGRARRPAPSCATSSGLVKDNTGYHLRLAAVRERGHAGRRHRGPAAAGHPPRPSGVVALVAFETVADAVPRWRLALGARLRSTRPSCSSTTGCGLVCDAFGPAPPFDRGAGPCTCWWRWPADHDPTDDAGRRRGRRPPRRRRGRGRRRRRRRTLWRYREDHTLAINTLARRWARPTSSTSRCPWPRWPTFVDTVAARVAAVDPDATHVAVRSPRRRQHPRQRDRPSDPATTGSTRPCWPTWPSWAAASAPSTASARPRRRWIHLTRSADELAAMAAIKHALDPDGVLNPNAVLPPPPR